MCSTCWSASKRGKPKRYAVGASGNYRVAFGWENQDAIDVDIENYHYRLVLDSLAQRCWILRSSHAGHRDLLAYTHGAAFEGTRKIYWWRGGRYVRVSESVARAAIEDCLLFIQSCRDSFRSIADVRDRMRFQSCGS